MPMGSPTAPLDFTLSDLKLQLERSNSRSLRYRSFISCKGPELGHMLLLNINRKPYMGSPIAPSHLILCHLERSKSGSLRFGGLIS